MEHYLKLSVDPPIGKPCSLRTGWRQRSTVSWLTLPAHGPHSCSNPCSKNAAHYCSQPSLRSCCATVSKEFRERIFIRAAQQRALLHKTGNRARQELYELF